MKDLGFVGAVLGLPRFHFNEQLFADLIREKSDGRKVPPGKEPEVDFEMGPIDGILGTYDPRSKKITIDVLENYLACFFRGPHDLRKRFEERMTMTLAHEGAHWRLHKRYGKAVVFEKMFLHGTFAALGISIVVLSYVVMSKVFREFVLGTHWSMTHPFAMLFESVAFILLFWFLTKTFTEVWHALVFGLTYRICYDERYARAAERRAAKDPRWGEVVKSA